MLICHAGQSQKNQIMFLGKIRKSLFWRNSGLAGFSTAFTPDQCWDSGKRPSEDCVAISANLTKDFGPAKRFGWGGWECGRRDRVMGTHKQDLYAYPPFFCQVSGEVGHLCVIRTLLFATCISQLAKLNTPGWCNQICLRYLSELLTGTFAWIAF